MYGCAEPVEDVHWQALLSVIPSTGMETAPNLPRCLVPFSFWVIYRYWKIETVPVSLRKVRIGCCLPGQWYLALNGHTDVNGCFSDLLFLRVNFIFFYVCGRMCVWVQAPLRPEEGVRFRLELQIVVSLPTWVLRIKLGSYIKTRHILFFFFFLMLSTIIYVF